MAKEMEKSGVGRPSTRANIIANIIKKEYVEKDKKLKEEWIGLQKSEKDLLEKIIKIYGTGNLDLTNGTFIPTPE
jgi:DNA topoisomerase IA